MAEVDPADLLDDINTDVMTPAWVCFNWQPQEIAREAYAGLIVDGERLLERDALRNGNFEVIVSGQRKGTGSSRETAAQCEKYAGIRIAIAASFAPIHARNNINLGTLMGGYDVLERLQRGEAIPLAEFTAGYDPITRQIIEAGNSIARTPYKWGGGHGRWQDTGYDCSGSVSFALAAAGLLDGPLASGPLMSWGEPGAQPGHFNLPHGVWVDRRGRVLVADRENDRIQVFDQDGKLLAIWPTKLIGPAVMYVDANDIVYVVEHNGGLVSVLTLDGERLAQWGDPAFRSCHGIWADSRGDLYVVRPGAWGRKRRVVKHVRVG